MKTIVVPTDLSREADHAIDVALVIARQMNASIHLMHVVPSIYEKTYASTANLPGEGKDILQADIDKAEAAMAELMKKYAVADLEITPEVKVGSIFQDLADNIVQVKADIIVWGTKGDSGLHEFFIGSHAEKVVRRSHCPVITVRKKIPDFKLKRIVFATDFTHKADKLLNLLKQWQQTAFFDIHLVYVNIPLHFATTFAIEDRMDKFLKKHAGVSCTTAIVNGYAERDGILKYAVKVGADLIAMLTHGREGLGHVIEGSIAEQIVNRANIPVLTYSLHTAEDIFLSA